MALGYVFQNLVSLILTGALQVYCCPSKDERSLLRFQSSGFLKFIYQYICQELLEMGSNPLIQSGICVQMLTVLVPNWVLAKGWAKGDGAGALEFRGLGHGRERRKVDMDLDGMQCKSCRRQS